MNTWRYSHVGWHKSHDYPLGDKLLPSQLPDLSVQEPGEAAEQSVCPGSSLTFFFSAQVDRKPTWQSGSLYWLQLPHYPKMNYSISFYHNQRFILLQGQNLSLNGGCSRTSCRAWRLGLCWLRSKEWQVETGTGVRETGVESQFKLFQLTDLMGNFSGFTCPHLSNGSAHDSYLTWLPNNKYNTCKWFLTWAANQSLWSVKKMQVGGVHHLELWLLILLESLGVLKSHNAQALSQTN